jgi:predicted metal-dependent hydrolase
MMEVQPNSQEHAALFALGLEQFNEGQYFECHETWEAYWKPLEAGLEKNLVQGLIQVSVAYYHWHKGNVKGALRLIDRALPRITEALPVFMGLDLTSYFDKLLKEHAKLQALQSSKLEDGATGASGELADLRPDPPRLIQLEK